MINFKKSKFAFTLAEVLITIGVIGVVAAITIPTLMTNYQKKQTVAKLKVVYSQLNQAVKKSVAENGDAASWDYSGTSKAVFDQYLKKYFVITTVQDNVVLKNKGICYKQTSGEYFTGTVYYTGNISIYTLPSGTDLLLYDAHEGVIVSSRLSLAVDLNGVSNPPNQFGKDYFSFHIDSHEMYMEGAYNHGTVIEFQSEPNSDRDVLLGKKSPKVGNSNNYACSKTGRGAWCGRLIQVDGWEIRKDYPW